MAISVKTPDASDDSDKTIHKDLKNGYTQEACQGFCVEYEKELASIAVLSEQYKEDCGPHREHMAKIIKRAAEQGFGETELKGQLTRRKHLRRADAVIKKMPEDRHDAFDQIGVWLAPLPLFEVA